MPILDDLTFTPILNWASLPGDPATEAKRAEMRDLVEEMRRLNPSGRVHCDPNDPSMGGARHGIGSVTLEDYFALEDVVRQAVAADLAEAVRTGAPVHRVIKAREPKTDREPVRFAFNTDSSFFK